MSMFISNLNVISADDIDYAECARWDGGNYEILL